MFGEDEVPSLAIEDEHFNFLFEGESCSSRGGENTQDVEDIGSGAAQIVLSGSGDIIFFGCNGELSPGDEDGVEESWSDAGDSIAKFYKWLQLFCLLLGTIIHNSSHNSSSKFTLLTNGHAQSCQP